MRAGPIAPRVFGAYTELVEAIFAEDTDAALAIADELCTPDFGRVDALRVVTLDDRQLGRGQTARYRRLVDDDQEVGLALAALEGAAFDQAAQRVNDALALLDAGVPELAEELRTLVHEVVVVDKPGHWPFGASSFQLWGALFLKLAPEASRVEIAEALAHESAHALLFGFSMGRPLVENEPDELYPSPLRSDPRPMDGVVHATYVMARMHYTAMRLLASGLLTEAETSEARSLIKRNRAGLCRGRGRGRQRRALDQTGRGRAVIGQGLHDHAIAAVMTAWPAPPDETLWRRCNIHSFLPALATREERSAPFRLRLLA